MDFSFVTDSLRPLVRSAHKSIPDICSLDNTALADLCLDNTGKPDTEQAVLRCARAAGCKNTEPATKHVSEYLYALFKKEYGPENGKNLRRVFVIHFEPLVNAFGLIMLHKPHQMKQLLPSRRFWITRRVTTQSSEVNTAFVMRSQDERLHCTSFSRSPRSPPFCCLSKIWTGRPRRSNPAQTSSRQ